VCGVLPPTTRCNRVLAQQQDSTRPGLDQHSLQTGQWICTTVKCSAQPAECLHTRVLSFRRAQAIAAPPVAAIVDINCSVCQHRAAISDVVGPGWNLAQLAALDLYATLSVVHPKALPASTIMAMLAHTLDQPAASAQGPAGSDEADEITKVVFGCSILLGNVSAVLQQDVQSAIELAIRVLQYNGEMLAWLHACHGACACLHVCHGPPQCCHLAVTAKRAGMPHCPHACNVPCLSVQWSCLLVLRLHATSCAHLQPKARTPHACCCTVCAPMSLPVHLSCVQAILCSWLPPCTHATLDAHTGHDAPTPPWVHTPGMMPSRHPLPHV
jgi:hypothetical protein